MMKEVERVMKSVPDHVDIKKRILFFSKYSSPHGNDAVTAFFRSTTNWQVFSGYPTVLNGLGHVIGNV